MIWPANVFPSLKLRTVLWLLSCMISLVACPALASSSVPLAWDPSADPTVVGYKIYYGTASQNYTSSIDVGNVTNATVALSADGTTYYFAATTYDVSGQESEFSNEANYTTPAAVTYQPPTLAPLGNVSINENAGLQSIALTRISPGSGSGVAITASSSNPALIATPGISYLSPSATGTLTFAPVKNVYGTAVITVTANNGQPQNNLTTRTFTVTVAAVYQPPTLAALSNVSLIENAGAKTVSLSGISLGTGSALSIAAVSSNPALIPNPTVNYTSPAATGSISFQPAKNMFGTAIVTVTANNGLSKSNLVTRTFTVNVAPVYTAPTLAPLNDVSLSENEGPQVVNLSGIDLGTGQSVNISAVSADPSLIANPVVNYSSPAASGTLTFAPVKNAFGTTTIMVTANNGLAQNNLATRIFTVTVAPINQPPTLNPISDLNLTVPAVAQTVNLGGISSGAANENQILTVTAVSSDTSVIPNPAVNYVTPNATGTLTFKPVANAVGAATITVTVNDGGASNNIVTQTFDVTVAPKATASGRPMLLNKLADNVALAGKSVTLKVSAVGKGPLKYQWKCNGTNVPGGTRPILTLKKVSAKQAGLYYVTVSNSAGYTNSTPAAVYVFPTPAALLTSSTHGKGKFGFNVLGVTGYKYAVEASTDMVHWSAVQTNTAPFVFADDNSSAFSQRYYRTVYQP
jgi:hypothetical protein